jgi:hypothetical protein
MWGAETVLFRATLRIISYTVTPFGDPDQAHPRDAWPIKHTLNWVSMIVGALWKSCCLIAVGRVNTAFFQFPGVEHCPSHSSRLGLDGLFFEASLANL